MVYLIRSYHFNKWTPNASLLKEDLLSIPIYVKLDDIPIVAFIEDGLSAMTTKLGTLVMLDSYTSSTCLQSLGCSDYACALIDVRAHIVFKEEMIVVIHDVKDYVEVLTVRVEYKWELPRSGASKHFNKWTPNASLLKEDLLSIPIYVKLDDIPIVAFIEDGLSAMTTKLGTPVMLDSYISLTCLQSWGCSDYACALIDVRAHIVFKEEMIVVIHDVKDYGEVLPVVNDVADPFNETNKVTEKVGADSYATSIPSTFNVTFKKLDDSVNADRDNEVEELMGKSGCSLGMAFSIAGTLIGLDGGFLEFFLTSHCSVRFP
nr:hypothetical protein [Tanacetum cinerariifolium]